MCIVMSKELINEKIVSIIHKNKKDMICNNKGNKYCLLEFILILLIEYYEKYN